MTVEGGAKTWGAMLWSQFGASIDMLENAIEAFPEAFWDDKSQSWYLVYHTLFWLDCYLDDSLEAFTPPLPFTRAEADPQNVIPERTYSKEELLAYLEHCREKCRTKLISLTDERAKQPCGFERLGLTVAELHLYNMRHVQHGAAQLNMTLRQKMSAAPGWVFSSKS